MDSLVIASVASILFGLIAVTIVIGFAFWWSLLKGSVKTLLGEW